MQNLFGCGTRDERREGPQVLPRCFVCPITKERMSDPVVTSDGSVFEHLAISAWFHMGQRTNPVTGVWLEDLKLTPLPSLRKAIEDFVAVRPELAKKSCMTSQSCDKAALALQEEMLVNKTAQEIFAPKLMAVAQSLDEAFKLPFDQINTAVKGAAAELRIMAEQAAQPTSPKPAAGLQRLAGPLRPQRHPAPAAGASPPRSPQLGTRRIPERSASPAAVPQLVQPASPLARPASPAAMPAPAKPAALAAPPARPAAERPASPAQRPASPAQRPASPAPPAAMTSPTATAARPRPAALVPPQPAPQTQTTADTSPRTPSMSAWGSFLAPLSPKPKTQPPPAGPAKQAAFECIDTFKGQEATVLCLSLVGSDKLAVGSFDGALRLWSLAEGKELMVLRSGGGAVLSVAALGPERVATGHYDGGARIWNLETQREACDAFRSVGGQIWSLLVLDDNRRLAAGSNDGSMRLWDIEASETIINVQGHAKAVTSLADLPCGRLASASKDGLIRLWNVERSEEGASLDAGAGAVTSITTLVDGRLAAGYQDGALRIWDTEAASVLTTLKAGGGQVWSTLRLGSFVVVGYETGTVRVWDWEAGAESTAFKGHTKATTCLARLADGRFASGSSDGALKLWAPQEA